METLDLHGKRHNAADEAVRKFLNFAELPCEIVTGNSEEMKEIVKRVVKEYGWHCHEQSAHNQGALTILEREGVL